MDQCKVGLEVVFKGVDHTYKRSKRGLRKKSKGKSKSNSDGKSKGFKTLVEKKIDIKIPIVGVKLQGKFTLKGDLVDGAKDFGKGFASGIKKAVLSGQDIKPVDVLLVGVANGLNKARKNFKAEWKSTAKSKPKLPSDKRKKVSSSRRRRSVSYSSRRRRSVSYSSRRRRSVSYSSRRRRRSSSSGGGGGGGGGWWRR